MGGLCLQDVWGKGACLNGLPHFGKEEDTAMAGVPTYSIYPVAYSVQSSSSLPTLLNPREEAHNPEMNQDRDKGPATSPWRGWAGGKLPYDNRLIR